MGQLALPTNNFFYGAANSFTASSGLPQRSAERAYN